jgi:hypothetical protein
VGRLFEFGLVADCCKQMKPRLHRTRGLSSLSEPLLSALEEGVRYVTYENIRNDSSDVSLTYLSPHCVVTGNCDHQLCLQVQCDC